MKKAYSFLFACCFALPVLAQQPVYHFPEEFYFVKEVPATEFKGKNFRFEIAVKENPADSLSKVRIHGVNVGKGPDDFLKSEFTVEKRIEQEWSIYTVVGTVRPDAARLWFYAAVNGNGSYYFDDLSFYIEESPGRWKQIGLFNHSFEEKGRNIFAGYYVSTRKSANVRTQLSNEVAKTGQHSLFVSTVRAMPAQSNSTAQLK